MLSSLRTEAKSTDDGLHVLFTAGQPSAEQKAERRLRGPTGGATDVKAGASIENLTNTCRCGKGSRQ
jgi:hypothetical protein